LNDSSPNYPFMETFIVSRNLFVGSASLSLSRYPVISSYELSMNYFSGPFFCGILDSLLVFELSIGSNFFTGSLSSNITSITSSLLQLNVSRNLFTGEFPSIFLIRDKGENNCDGADLETFDVSYNFFTNKLPELNMGCVIYFANLYFVSFSNNAFTGQVPANYSHFKISSDLLFNNNLLSGPLSLVLSLFTANSKVVDLELSNNVFTGNLLPTEFFSNNGNLTLFDVSNNCLTGSIPSKVCELQKIEIFNLDGASSASHCRKFLFPADFIFNSFISENSFEGSIPLCLFSLPKIQTLHLSGNGLTGSLSSGLSISNSLVDLSLSYNLLTGSIPNSLQVKQNWQSLDLSYNKFSGTLSSSFSVQNESSLLSLQLNRLSGDVPSAVITSSSIGSLSVLEGNVFYCSSFDKSSTLPADDEDYRNYSCSTDTALLIVVLWSSVVGIVGIYLLTFFFFSTKQPIMSVIQDFLFQAQSWRNSLSSASASALPRTNSSDTDQTVIQLSLLELTTYFTTIEKVVLIMCLYLLFLILPLWAVLKKYYATYTFQYIWTVGALFLSGETAGSIMLIIFCLSSIFLFYWIERISVENRSDVASRISNASIVPTSLLSDDSPVKWKLQCLLYMLYFIIFIFDSVVMLLVDVAFVVAVLNVSASQLVVIEIFVAMLRVWINNSFLWTMIPFFSNRLERLVFYLTNDPLFSGEGESSVKLESLIDKKYFLGVLMIINKILFPILVIMIILPDCFYYAFFQAPTVSSSSTYETCYFYEDRVCVDETTSEVSSRFIPPFTYYYLCSSNLITYYTAVYVWTFFLVGIINPCVKLVVKYFYDQFNDDQKEETNVERTEKPIDSKEKSTVLLFIRKSSYYLILNRFKKYHPSPQPEVLPLFSVDRFICQVNSYLAFMFCFGLLFPPLGIIAGISIVLVINFEYLTLGKLLKETRELGYDWYEQELAKESKGILRSLRSTIGWMIFISCLLFGFFVFDSIGDEVGWEMALIGMIITIVLPVLVLNVYWNIQRYSNLFFISSYKIRERSKNEIELRESSNVRNNVEIENPIRN
jgi:hypothetical protein